MGWAIGGEVFRGGEGGGEGDGRVGSGNCMVWRLWDGIWVGRGRSRAVIIAPTLLVSGCNTEREI